ncbi:MAG TPA: heparin lyase I family protein [Burkholderiales bacterium]
MGIRRLTIALASCAALPAAGQAPIRLPDAASAQFSCGFEKSWAACGFVEQSNAPGRAAMVNVAGMRGARLRTEPGDRGVAGSGTAERVDLALSSEATGCSEGREQWWAHSILFPADYVAPVATSADPWAWGVVFDFHQTGSEGQANFQIEALPDPVGLRFAISAGPVVSTGAPGSPTRRWPIGPIVRDSWYHFLYHVKWSSGEGGYFDAWVNGEQKLEYRGPTLYAGQGCYLKLANYHTPVGKPVSVIHARVLRGATREAVSPVPQH